LDCPFIHREYLSAYPPSVRQAGGNLELQRDKNSFVCIDKRYVSITHTASVSPLFPPTAHSHQMEAKS
jgi:hypothetical protein